MEVVLKLVNSEQVSEGLRVWHVSWSPSGQHLASCGEDKIVRVWRVVQEEEENDKVVGLRCVATLEDAQSRTLRSCEWSPDGLMMACASFDGTVVVWETRSVNLSLWEQVATLEGHENEVKSVAWSADGRWLATCGRDKRVWVWEKLLPGNDFECVSMLQGHSQDVKFIQWHPKESVLFSASYDDSIKVWSEDSGGSGDDEFYCTATLTGHSSTVWGLAIDPGDNGRRLISCSADHCFILWHCDGPVAGNDKVRGTWRAMHCLQGVHSTFPIYSLDWCPETGLIVSGGGDNALALCRVARDEGGGDGLDSLELVSVFSEAHSGDVNCARWRPFGTRESIVASASDDGTVKLWSLQY